MMSTLSLSRTRLLRFFLTLRSLIGVERAGIGVCQIADDMKLEARVMRSIAQRDGVAILRSEPNRVGSRLQLTRVLANLVRRELLGRVGLGVYAKTKFNRFTSQRTPAASFETIAAETLQKLGIEATHGKLAAEDNSGESTQIPMLPIGEHWA